MNWRNWVGPLSLSPAATTPYDRERSNSPTDPARVTCFVNRCWAFDAGVLPCRFAASANCLFGLYFISVYLQRLNSTKWVQRPYDRCRESTHFKRGCMDFATPATTAAAVWLPRCTK